MYYQSADEASESIVGKGWEEKTNTDPFRCIDRKHSAYKVQPYNEQDPEHPALLDGKLGWLVFGTAVFVLAMALLAMILTL